MGMLNAASPEGGASVARIGDVRTLTARDRDGSVTKTFTLHRTNRPYVEDLCDAYNVGRDHEELRWVVTPGGELKLTHDLAWSRGNLKASKQSIEFERREFNAARNKQREGVGE